MKSNSKQGRSIKGCIEQQFRAVVRISERETFSVGLSVGLYILKGNIIWKVLFQITIPRLKHKQESGEENCLHRCPFSQKRGEAMPIRRFVTFIILIDKHTILVGRSKNTMILTMLHLI